MVFGEKCEGVTLISRNPFPPVLLSWPFHPLRIISSSLDHKKPNDFNLVNGIDRDFRFFSGAFDGFIGRVCLFT